MWEQKEEESLMKGILDKINLIDDAPGALYLIDNELTSINSQRPANGEMA